jgi:hypothetical protein
MIAFFFFYHPVVTSQVEYIFIHSARDNLVLERNCIV